MKLNREAFLKPHKIYLGHAGGGVQMSKLKAGKGKIMASEEEHENYKFQPICHHVREETKVTVSLDLATTYSGSSTAAAKSLHLRQSPALPG